MKKIRRQRDNAQVGAALNRIREAAQDERVNLIPPILEAFKEYASVGEICGVLREAFGEYHAYGVGI